MDFLIKSFIMVVKDERVYKKFFSNIIILHRDYLIRILNNPTNDLNG